VQGIGCRDQGSIVINPYALPPIPYALLY